MTRAWAGEGFRGRSPESEARLALPLTWTGSKESLECGLETARACSEVYLRNLAQPAGLSYETGFFPIEAYSCPWFDAYSALSYEEKTRFIQDHAICAALARDQGWPEKTAAAEHVALRLEDGATFLDAAVSLGAKVGECTVAWPQERFAARLLSLGEYLALDCAWARIEGPDSLPFAYSVRSALRNAMRESGADAGDIPEDRDEFDDLADLIALNGWWRVVPNKPLDGPNPSGG